MTGIPLFIARAGTGGGNRRPGSAPFRGGKNNQNGKRPLNDEVPSEPGSGRRADALPPATGRLPPRAPPADMSARKPSTPDVRRPSSSA